MIVPRSVLLLCVMLASAGIVAVLLGSENYEDVLTGEWDWESSRSPLYLAIASGMLCLASALPVMARRAWSSRVAMIGLTLALSTIVAHLPELNEWWFLEETIENSRNEIWWLMWDMILRPSVRWYYFFIALGAGYFGWHLIAKNSEWFGHEPRPGTSTARGLLGVAGTVLLSTVAWFLIFSFGLFSFIETAVWTESEWLSMLSMLDSPLAFSAALAILIVRLNERADVDEKGVRISLGPTNWTVFKLRWNQLRRVEIVRHMRSPSTVVLKALPFTFSIHAKRYKDGEELVNRIHRESKERNIRHGEWAVLDTAPWLAAALVAWGAMLIVYVQSAQYADWMEMAKTNYPPANFAEIAGPVRYGVLSTLSAACFGTALGLLSAFHCAGVRPVLLSVAVLALAMVWPGSLLHWLVWIAIFHIYMAIKFQDPTSIVQHPTINEWSIGMTLTDYAPIIAAVFYLLAVVLASRSLRDGSGDEVPTGSASES